MKKKENNMTEAEYVKKIQTERGGHKAKKWVDMIKDVYNNGTLEFAMWMGGPKPIGWKHATDIIDQLDKTEQAELMAYINSAGKKYKDDIDLKVLSIIAARKKPTTSVKV